MFRFIVVMAFFVSGCAASSDADDSLATDQEPTEVREGHLGPQPTSAAEARVCSAGDFELVESSEGTRVRAGTKTTLLRIPLAEARRQLGENTALYRAVHDGTSPREEYAALEARMRCHDEALVRSAVTCPSCTARVPELAAPSL